MIGQAKANVMIAAMGGEGGGVLADWILGAAQDSGLVVQSTSIPGVAQRTGATTYYIEMSATTGGNTTEVRPIMSLYPVPGNVDVMIASELVEAGRSIENGFVTPNCTTLISSLHRVYAISERSAMVDTRYNAENILLAARELAYSRIMFDMDQTARANGSMINAVLLGAVAGSDRLPIQPTCFENAIRRQGVAVERNLAAFSAGMEMARRAEEPVLPSEMNYKWDWLPANPKAALLLSRAKENFKEETFQVIMEGINRLIDYQNPHYAEAYYKRIDQISEKLKSLGDNDKILIEIARQLAVWMSYEDVIRVAQAKTRPERFARIREEVGAEIGEPLRIIDYLKPGAEEIASLLPRPVAERLLRNVERGGWAARINIGLHIPSTAIWGFLLLKILSSLKWLRPHGFRFALEQSAIDDWLSAISRAIPLNIELAHEIALMPKLRKGYSDTFRRGQGNYDGIMKTLVQPTLGGDMSPVSAANAVRRAREAATTDPEGKALTELLDNS